MSLRAEVGAGGPTVVHGAATALARAVSALVDNALDHAAGAVEVRLARTGRNVVVEVLDDGPGIPTETLPRMFDRFSSDRRPAAETGGRRHFGLGLALVSEIATRHGGSVTAENRPPPRRGALPAARRPGGTRRPSRPAPDPRTGVSMSNDQQQTDLEPGSPPGRAARERRARPAAELAARRCPGRQRRHRLGRRRRDRRRRRERGHPGAGDRRPGRARRRCPVDGARRVRLGEQPARRADHPDRQGASRAGDRAGGRARGAGRALRGPRPHAGDRPSGRGRADRARRARRAPRRRAQPQRGRRRQRRAAPRSPRPCRSWSAG